MRGEHVVFVSPFVVLPNSEKIYRKSFLFIYTPQQREVIASTNHHWMCLMEASLVRVVESCFFGSSLYSFHEGSPASSICTSSLDKMDRSQVKHDANERGVKMTFVHMGIHEEPQSRRNKQLALGTGHNHSRTSPQSTIERQTRCNNNKNFRLSSSLLLLNLIHYFFFFRTQTAWIFGWRSSHPAEVPPSLSLSVFLRNTYYSY